MYEKLSQLAIDVIHECKLAPFLYNRELWTSYQLHDEKAYRLYIHNERGVAQARKNCDIHLNVSEMNLTSLRQHPAVSGYTDRAAIRTGPKYRRGVVIKREATEDQIKDLLEKALKNTWKQLRESKKQKKALFVKFYSQCHNFVDLQVVET